ncbi:hypothetical protein [Methylobacterium organophilum]|uniref:Transmembrane protein n=1 Tax=Methylobacterium organophilum TaxID=410 RepID=A0ABQ4T5F7_METOR|nr:hypothetical protein [Methylobacterium organophilum]UMY17084.1 hypothetical protein MMB17_20925 [Methylobacterium organophilum]GJE26892.1 hypothetical protein LKMONMHP_1746 [Methylobacterium organophilum]
MPARLPGFLRLWFALDVVLALAPPLHWRLNGAAPVLGLPPVLAYLWGTSLFIAASTVAAYLAERREA